MLNFFLKYWQYKLARRLCYIIGILIFTAIFGHSTNALADYPATEGVIFNEPSPNNKQAQTPQLLCPMAVGLTVNGYVITSAVLDEPSAYCRVYRGSGTFTKSISYSYTPYYCPPPDTLSGSTCIVPIVCTAGQTVSSGYYELGTSPTTNFPATQCKNGCLSTFEGVVPSNRYMKNGKWQYTALGAFISSSQSCSPDSTGTGLVSTPTSGVPTSTCGAGQVSGTINGVYSCIKSSTGEVENPNTPQPAKTVTTSTVTNADGTTTETSTESEPNGAGISIMTHTGLDGVKSQTISVIHGRDGSAPTATASTGGGSGTGSGFHGIGAGTRADGTTQTAKDVKDGTKEGLKTFCTENPNSPMCKENTSGEAKTFSKEDLYTPQPEKSFQNSISNFGTSVQSAGFYQSAIGYFNVSVPAGSCGGMNQSFEFGGGTFNVDLDSVFCSSTSEAIYDVLKIGLQLGASFMAFMIAFIL